MEGYIDELFNYNRNVKSMGNLIKKNFLLCAQGRVEGAIKKGKTWLIPEGTKKPEDPRRVQKIGQVK